MPAATHKYPERLLSRLHSQNRMAHEPMERLDATSTRNCTVISRAWTTVPNCKFMNPGLKCWLEYKHSRHTAQHGGTSNHCQSSVPAFTTTSKDLPELPATLSEFMKWYVYTCCPRVGLNLKPFYDAWGLDYDNGYTSAVDVCSTFPAWTQDPTLQFLTV